ncbi:MAG: adenosylmethionine--8-amino-7-oxononanoate transaminase [Verrucomicrobia bacterium]|nr:adenosylmethionine--8-amino-7-oxononanoate transaminase [Verrucomicrobiota bacterium]
MSCGWAKAWKRTYPPAELKYEEIVRLDRAHVWHPFTPSSPWMDPEFHPVSIQAGEGAWLMATDGKRYLDGNSSIWTNLHGHRHPKLDAALFDQLGRIAHSSFLGLTHEPAVRLANELISYANHPVFSPKLTRVFFSDDGSTAVETGLKMILQGYAQNGEPQRKDFISPEGAYHGDTMGAMSLGKSDTFHHHYQPLLFPTRRVMAPACYRCPFNKSKPQLADARHYRKCDFECAALAVEEIERAGDRLAAWVLEPKVQGAAGMIMHPEGYANTTASAARKVGAKVLFDEVLTGCHRTGTPLAAHGENVMPDVLALAKGLTAGYLPLAATLATEEIFGLFQGDPEKAFFHGHSYTANPLGCSVALANLHLLTQPETHKRMMLLFQNLRKLSQRFWQHPHVGDVRQEGGILAVEIVANRSTRARFPAKERRGARICRFAQELGLITRPIGDVLVLMPPFCTSNDELEQMTESLFQAIRKELP